MADVGLSVSAQKLRGDTPRVEVIWEDSADSADAWTNEEDLLRETREAGYMLTMTVGYLIEETDTQVVVVQSLSRESHNSRGVKMSLTIPKFAIHDIRVLRR